MTVRVAIQGWGSEGDLRPLLALAARLRQRDHEVHIAVTPVDGKDYAPLAAKLGVTLRQVPESMPMTLQRLVEDAASKDPRKVIAKVLELTFDPHVEAMFEAAMELCARADVAVAGSSCWTMKAASLASKVPFAMLDYVPGIVPSRVLPPDFLPPWRWLARPAWALLSSMMDRAFLAAPRAFFAKKRLPPIAHAIPDVIFSEQLNLHAASPAFWPPAPDWSDIHCVCGEIVMPDDAEPWQPSNALRAFLDEGEAPALMTLGSWEHMLPDRARAFLVASARASKRRAIVQTKLAREETREGDVFVLPWVPHRQIISSCSLVVHHGGAGTTHMALRAGKPALALPFILEQRMWGARIERARAGRALSFWKATPEKVGALVREFSASEDLHAGARAMADAMASEDGGRVACERLELLAKTFSRSAT